jgi:DNA-binding response OmpR family regulator
LRTTVGATITFIAAAPDLLGDYVVYLRDDGYVVSLARNVCQASIQGEAQCPDLVFLDLGASPPAGLAMLRELKADVCLGSIPLVMLASFDCLNDIGAGLKLGARDYVIKTETTAVSLARGVPGWVRAGTELQVEPGLQIAASSEILSR